LLVFESGADAITAISFLPGSWDVVVGHRSGQLTRWSPDGSNKPLLDDAQPSMDTVSAIQPAPDSDELWLQSSAVMLRWPSPPDRQIQVYCPPASASTILTSLAVLPRHRLVIGQGHADKPMPGMLYIVQSEPSIRILSSLREKAGVRALTADAATQTVAWSTGDRQAVIWKIDKPDQVRLSRKETARAIALSAGAEELALAEDWNITLWSLTAKQPRHTLTGHKGRVTCLRYLPEGELISGSWDGTVRFWQPATGQSIRTLDWQCGRILCLAVSPEGDRVAVGTDRGTFVIWDRE
jgi:hypothetical protein